MKHLERSTRHALACLVLLGSGTGVARAQVAPEDRPDPQNPPSEPDPSDPNQPSPRVPRPISPDEPNAPTSAPRPVVETPAPIVVKPPPVEKKPQVIVVQPEKPSWEKGYGAAVSLGGGVSRFTDPGMRRTAGTGGFWDLRGHFGLRSPLGFEVAYIGSAGDINSIQRLGPSKGAKLVGSGAEAVLRFNLLTDSAIQPYMFGGAALKHYDVVGADFTTSANGIADSDDVLELPVGVGMAYRMQGLFADFRFTFRGAMDENLVRGKAEASRINDTLGSNSGYLPMHNWAAGARVGYEF